MTAEPRRTPRDADPGPDPNTDGWLGDFNRGPAVFSVFRSGLDDGGHPLAPPQYRIECNDGAGPKVMCRFTDDPAEPADWFGAWNGDDWCGWILDQARKTILDPEG